jgi:hypothetical protein
VGRPLLTIRYEDRAEQSIQDAKLRWARIEDIVNAIEWAILHDLQIGQLVSERGVRGFVMPGARSIDEPDVDVLYQEEGDQIIIHDLTFRDAKAHHSGHA